MKKLVDNGTVLAWGEQRIIAYLLERGISPPDLGGLDIVDDVIPSQLLLSDLVDVLPRQALLLIGAALQVGLDIGIADAQGMEVVEAARLACVNSFGGSGFDDAVEHVFSAIGGTDAVLEGAK